MTISFPAGETPKYAALRLGIERFYAALQPPLETLRRRCFNDLAFPDPGKAADDEEPFTYTDAHEAIIDEAVALFLTEMAGSERTAAGFAAGSGVIQRQDLQLFSTGLQRGASLMDTAPTFRGDRESPAVQAMLDSAFKRLSQRGTLRLEDIRDDIHGILTSAQAAGISPLETARQLAAQFDEYSGYEFERLARTEAAFAAEAGARAQLSELGVESVEWLISAGACPLCEDLAAGGPYALDDEENLPPAHPNCLCSVSPVVDADQGDQPSEEGDP